MLHAPPRAPADRAAMTLRSCLACLVALLALAPARAQVVIHEIHYRPDDKTVREEFVELHNAGAEAVDLSGWFFSNGIRHEFAAGTTLAAGGFLVVAQDPGVLESSLGHQGAQGPWTGRLSRSGERLVLRSADGSIVDEVDYRDVTPWPMAADGQGSSMELIHPALDNNLAGSWRSSGFVGTVPAERITYVAPEEAGWSYRKALSEPAGPVGAWRELDYSEDASWLVGRTSIGFGDDDDNTVLDDMRNSYRGVYLRKRFRIADEAPLPELLVLGLYVDDGAAVWINGVEVLRARVPAGEMPFTAEATSSFEARWVTSLVPSPSTLLRRGDNIVAVHALNTSLTSSDFSIDVELFQPSAEDIPDLGAFAAPPTPGAQNSVHASNAPPAIRQVTHIPALPRGGQPVAISVKVTDPDGVASVRLEYQVVLPGQYVRLSDPGYAEGWSSLEMLDDGEGVDSLAADDTYTVVIPASANVHRGLVRYRITAADSAGLAVRSPFRDDPQPNFAYFVHDGIPGWRGRRDASSPLVEYSESTMRSLPAYHLIATEADVLGSQYNSSFDGRHFEGTLVFDGEVYDHIEFENRGEFSTYVSGKNKWRLHFLRGHGFRARDVLGQPYRETWDKLNVGACATPWVPTNRGMAGLDEALALAAYGAAGVPSPYSHWFEFRVIDDAVEADPSNQYEGDLWGLYLAIEHTDKSFLDERGLPDGNSYKIESGTGDKRNQGPTQALGQTDYQALRSGYGRSQPASWWRANVDLEVYFSFRATNRIVNNMDLREGWNICMYHNPDDDRWSVIPWDLDMLYMPVTHWSGVMDFQNCLSIQELAIEYRNRARELGDLLFNEEGFGALALGLGWVVNPPGRAQTMVDVDEAMWNQHPRTSSSHRGWFYRNPATHSARGGTITRVLNSADHEGMVDWARSFGLTGYGADGLASHARDSAIPETPTVSAIGNGFPIDSLLFEVSPFRDPGGDGTFGGIEWRLARRPDYDSSRPGRILRSELESVWELEANTLVSPVRIPPERVAEGEIYRVRARMIDSSGRASHWSEPLEFTAEPATTPFPEELALRISEIHFHPPESEEHEFLEIVNTSAGTIDLAAISLAGGVEFSFAAAGESSLAAGEHAVLVANERVFRARYGDGAARVLGEYRGRLGNGGDRVQLVHGVSRVFVDVSYEDTWQPLADGSGRSLVVRDERTPAGGLGLASAWRASTEDGGSPGRVDPDSAEGGARLPGDVDADGSLTIGDAVRLLGILFGGTNTNLPCDGELLDPGNLAIVDFDQSGGVAINDPIGLLGYLFQGGPAHRLGTGCVEVPGCTSRCE